MVCRKRCTFISSVDKFGVSQYESAFATYAEPEC